VSSVQLRDLRGSLSTAQQRASAAEAKVDMLQEAVRKAEERVARLEMERSSRSVAAVEVGPAAADGSREAQLVAEAKLLREELAAAQESAAAATGHSKQFEMLAKTADEALKSVQADHDRFKQEAAARFNAIATQVEELRSSLAAREAELREAKQAEKEFAAECERLDREFTSERNALRAAVDSATQDRAADIEHLSKLREDVARLHRQLEDARRQYDAEVVSHGDAVTRLRNAERSVASLQERLSSVVQELDSERLTKVRVVWYRSPLQTPCACSLYIGMLVRV
jgi:chromosome segregation ATPase